MEANVIDNFGLILVIVPVLLLKRRCYISVLSCQGEIIEIICLNLRQKILAVIGRFRHVWNSSSPVPHLNHFNARSAAILNDERRIYLFFHCVIFYNHRSRFLVALQELRYQFLINIVLIFP